VTEAWNSIDTEIGDLEPWTTLDRLMAVILCYSTKFGSFGNQLRQKVTTNTVCNKNVVQRI